MVTHNEILLPSDNFRATGIALFSGVAAVCGTRHQRSILRDALEPRADRLCLFGAGGAVFGTGHHWLARLSIADGDKHAALQHLERAAQICNDADATFWADRARSEAQSLTTE